MSARGPALLVVATLALTGCVSLEQEAPEKTRYVLDVTRTGEVRPLNAGVVRIGRIRVGAAFERKGIVYQTGDTTLESDFYHEFYSPPGSLVRQLTARWITDSGLFRSVLGGADPVASDWLLEGRVNNLYADIRDADAPRAILEIEFSLVDEKSRELDVVFKKRYRRAQQASTGEPAVLVDAWSELLTNILTSLERDLRAELSKRRRSR